LIENTWKKEEEKVKIKERGFDQKITKKGKEELPLTSIFFRSEVYGRLTIKHPLNNESLLFSWSGQKWSRRSHVRHWNVLAIIHGPCPMGTTFFAGQTHFSAALQYAFPINAVKGGLNVRKSSQIRNHFHSLYFFFTSFKNIKLKTF